MRLIALLAALAVALLATPVEAAPVTAAVGAVVSAVQGLAAGSLLANVALRIGSTVAVSALAGALARAVDGNRQGRRNAPGIVTRSTTTGETGSRTFILGRYATAGQLAYPPLTHGGNTGTRYKTLVIALSTMPGAQLLRLAFGDEWVPITATLHPDYGNELGGRYAGKAWVKFHDGTQAAADAMLLAKYGGHARFPYTADMIGVGVAYAIVTLKYDATLFPAVPRLRFELQGAPLYDPRADDSVGGAGSQRLADPTTWAATDNPVVMIYNILLGIDIGDGTWGGRVAQGDLPFATWAAAMDACDAPIGSSPACTAGFEVRLDRTPRAVIGELLNACAGELAEVGGRWLVRVGAPAVAASLLVDDDIIITRARTLRPTVGLQATHNAVDARWIDPAAVYAARDAARYLDAQARHDDGGRTLVDTVPLNAVTDPGQVARLQQAWLADDRRWRSHEVVLPPRLVSLEPFDVVSFTSAQNGYVARPFEVVRVRDDPHTLLQAVSLREIDYADWP